MTPGAPLPCGDFHPAWWLPGPHLQSIWGRLSRPRRLVLFRREIVPTPDGDELLLDHVNATDGAPRLLLLHGLEGSSYSVYVQGLAKVARRTGLAVTALNFRSCARLPDDIGTTLPNKRPRFYHSGDTADADLVLHLLHRRAPKTPLLAAGASLGGNVLLKWLGENPGQTLVRAAATMSVPYDLAAGARFLEKGAGRAYVAVFLSTLKAKVKELVVRFPEAKKCIDLERTLASKTFWEFDDAATGPLHGFTGANDYYTRSSSISFVGKIKTPTLSISAADDPFIPPDVLPKVRAAASSHVTCLFTEKGGHVGFVAGDSPARAVYWAEETIVQWLAGKVSRTAS
ncbi:MAG: YheT family hydrolase [Thermoanaerobaculia bacterium]